ncbi:TetR/AcrR family transcriptional regulator [Epidermidibacterium keratini]
MVNKRPGRPRGPSDVADRILSAARKQFLADGYDATSVRSIAESAGVSHSLVNYHFGSKSGLFSAVLDLVMGPGQVLDRVAARHQGSALAPHLLAQALALWDSPALAPRLRELIRDAAEDPQRAEVLRGYLHSTVVDRFAEQIGGPDAHRLASGAAAVMAGVFLTRYVIRLEPIASMSREEIVRYVAPVLQASLTPRRR